MYKLYKHSKPSWVKRFETVDGLTEEVGLHTCVKCKEHYGYRLLEMLSSDCGCEYSVEGLTLDYPLTVPEHIQLIYEHNEAST